MNQHLVRCLFTETLDLTNSQIDAVLQNADKLAPWYVDEVYREKCKREVSQ